MFNLRTVFKQMVTSIQEAFARQDACNRVLRALEAGHTNAAKIEIEDYDFNEHQQREIFDSLMTHDNLEVFKLAFKKWTHENPNHMLTRNDNVDLSGAFYCETVPLLSHAISNKAGNIALFVAQNPQTDITLTGFTTDYSHAINRYTTNIHSSKTDRAHESALNLSRRAGMNDVTAALLVRTALLRVAEADRLNAEAGRLRF